MDWMTTKEAAEQWGISVRRVQSRCDKGQINGAKWVGGIWLIPQGTPKPIDGRTKAAKQRQDRMENKK